MGKRKILVLATLGVALLILGALLFWHKAPPPGQIAFEFAGMPTLGNEGAPLEFVVFEDLRCGSCRQFSQDVFPEIESHYIATGKARYTFIPVAFIQGSKRLANAALAVHASTPHRFFPYLERLFAEFSDDGATREQLVELAMQVGGIDLRFLSHAIATRQFYGELDRNLKMAKKTLGNDFGTPALYVNGFPLPTRSFEALEKKIQKVAP